MKNHLCMKSRVIYSSADALHECRGCNNAANECRYNILRIRKKTNEEKVQEWGRRKMELTQRSYDLSCEGRPLCYTGRGERVEQANEGNVQHGGVESDITHPYTLNARGCSYIEVLERISHSHE